MQLSLIIVDTFLYFFFQNYSRQSSLLLKLFSGVRSHQASPHLAQFLLRIDFNRYFSSSSQIGLQ